MQQYLSISIQFRDMLESLEEIDEMDDSIYRSVLGAKPLPASVRDAGSGGKDKYSDLKSSGYDEIVIETSQEMDRLKAKIKMQKNSYTELISLAARNQNRLVHLSAVMPVRNQDLSPDEFRQIRLLAKSHDTSME